MEKNYKYLNAITAFFVTVLLVSNIASSKILSLGPLTFDGGTILFPLSYIFGDILTEVYGYSRARRVIWTGFAMIILASLTFMAVGALPPASGWEGQSAYETILGLTPRIVAASVFAYLVGEFINSVILAKIKIATSGKWLWLRTITSTIFGEGADTVLFVFVAFSGILSGHLLASIMLSNYIFKVAIEVLCTPLTYYITTFLKRRENEDYYDTATRFNPFSFG
ncbi:transporter [Candidatus Uhrbacteria bacterium RIFCSPLOWO2_02_FULL_49_11]|uniref:Probable queuosine precursor transporter n=1 Tax=Candidatus Uhrbacteria bacterium RIFCSPLOWO2_02_FULL_49_11 TaxID=1802409 RepID=A0A1F7VF83_9BACT|nr:MAG: transporter [Candidatus Uhrbacteria bacterium RIFCSPLOWO2_02_FULL_49_11]